MRIDMAIEYLGLSEINGPLVAVEGVRGAFYDEIVELVVEGKQKKLGRIVEINNDYAVVQVFEHGGDVPFKYACKVNRQTAVCGAVGGNLRKNIQRSGAADRRARRGARRGCA